MYDLRKGGKIMFQRGKLSWLIWNAVVAALLVVLGVLTCINSGESQFQSIIVLIVAIFVIVDAGFRILFDVLRVIHIGHATVVKTDYGAIVAASAELAIGVALIGISNTIKDGGPGFQQLFVFLGNFIGTVFIVCGAVSACLATIYFIKKANSIPENVGICIGAAIVITIGILVLVFCRNQENFMKVFFISFGVILMLAGLGALTLTIALYVKTNKKAGSKPTKGEEKADVIDAAPVKEPKEEPKEEHPEAPAEEEPKAEEEKPEE